jgi:hypothetical protein
MQTTPIVVLPDGAHKQLKVERDERFGPNFDAR